MVAQIGWDGFSENIDIKFVNRVSSTCSVSAILTQLHPLVRDKIGTVLRHIYISQASTYTGGT